MSRLSKRIADLSPEKREALLRKLAEKKGSGAAAQPAAVEVVERSGPAPLSFSQQRLWFLEQLTPGTALWNDTVVIALRGELDAAALERSFNSLVERHESLRTTFGDQEGTPFQVVAPPPRLELPRVDLRAMPAAQRRAEARRLIDEATRRPFDLVRGPLLGVELLQLDEKEHLLRVTIHHIISDGWSMGILVGELAEFYRAYREGAPPSLPALPLQYQDFARWERNWLTGEVLDSRLRYWKQKLGGPLPVLELPADRVRPARPTHLGAKHAELLPTPVLEGVKALAQRERATPFMVLLAAFKALLARFSGQEDILVGSPVAGRGRSDTEGLIGLFLNTLVLRTELGGDPTFRELLGRVRETCLGAFAHQDLPFAYLVEALQPERNLSRTPLYQVMLIFQNTPASISDRRFSGLAFDWSMGDTKLAKLDITLSAAETPSGLLCSWEYSTELFDAGTIARMAAHFRQLVEVAVRAPDTRIAALGGLDEEARRLIAAVNDTAAEIPEPACLHRRIEAQAARTPDAVAVEFEGQRLTYGELDQRSNQLAWHLRALGVGPEVLVGLCMERGLDLVLSLIGILKAGGAYIPLDPAYPRERLAFMLEDSRAPLVITHHSLAGVVTEGAARRLELDRAWPEIQRLPAEPMSGGAGPEGLAYVLYTSGSTGKPKGVQIPHRNVVSFLASMQRQPGLGAQDVLVAVTSLSFDIAGLELYLPLTVGARLVIASREVASDGGRLAELMARAGATAMQATPSTWRMLLLGGWQGDRRLKALCGGEALPVPLAEELSGRVAALWNLYGPTETTIWSTLSRVERGAGVTIGAPIANTQVYVLDRRLRPVPIGAIGELYIGGAGVARGYLGRPELTADRFVPDAFGDTPGARLYRTGDLVRLSVDGRLHYLGRADFQVKVRGHRIELGEVETTLGRHPGVREAVVMVREDVPGDQRLVAYVVPHQQAPGDLRAHLAERLPEYMVPSTFVVLESFPLTPNGKVDRKALPAPAHQATSQYVAPRSVLEELIATIWGQVLGVPKVGIHDRFFELGGHSLTATQVTGKLREALKRDVPLRFLFEAATVAELAHKVEQDARGEEGPPPPPLVPRSPEVAPPLSFSQLRLWFIDRFNPGGSDYNVPIAIRVQGALDVGVLERCVQEMVLRHEVLRTTFHEVQGQPVQVIAPRLDVPIRQVDLSGMPDDARELERHLKEHAFTSFDLTRGPLIRLDLLRLSPREHILALAMHHIITDVSSVSLFMAELDALYVAFQQGKPSPLSPPPLQYGDFAAWQRGWLQGEALQTQIDYWRKQLAGASPALDLPTDRPRPPVRTGRGNFTPEFRFSGALVQALRNLARREGVTLFMLMEAAFHALLYRYSGQSDISIGTTVSGRSRPETARMMGVFINTLVLRVDVPGSAPFRELLGLVRRAVLGAFSHQDIPFERIVDELTSGSRDLSRSPLFQVAFDLHPGAKSEFKLGELHLDTVAPRTLTSKFDLAVALFEGEEGMYGWVEYSTDLFDDSTIYRLLAHYERLLEGVVAEPGRRLVELPLLDEEERRRVLVEWNRTSAPAPGSTLQEMFEEQVRRTPEAVAVEYAGERRTYGELNRWANQLAHALRSRGVGPDVVVGLCLDRGLELVAGMLGIVKAGGAYLPLDASLPVERLTYMMQDAGVPVLLTQERLAYELPSHGEMRLSVDEDWGQIERQPETEPAGRAGPGNLAYVIYTSGSTGKPKGVQVEHRGVCNTIREAIRDLEVKPGKRVLQFASVGFDVSVQEVFTALLGGATLVMATKEELLPGPGMAELLKDRGVTTLMLAAPVVAALPEEGLEGVDAMMVGGEACTEELVERWGKGRRLVQGYGPTEASITVTSAVCRPGEGKPALGRPYANTRLYVLNEGMQPVPVGVVGELYIGGRGLARGYLGRPDLTAERFCPDPFSGEEGARLYRTGDRVKYRPDGNLEFVGRTDFQVKLRGFRIELGEIEAALSKHSAVDEAVVLLREDSPGDKRLVAYARAHPGRKLTATALREHLRERLPQYMVPSAFVVMEALPLTPNGKVDREALPAPEQSDAEGAGFVPPRTPIEELLAGIWRELLGLERVGVHEGFFDVGGHSLLATQVVSRIREALDVEVPLRAFFDSPTVAGLAKWLESAQPGKATGAPPLKPAGREGRLPLSFAQQRLWFMDQLQPGDPSFNVAFVLQLTGPLDPEALERSLNAIVQRHEVLRTTFAVVDNDPVQVIAPVMELRVPREDLSALPAAERDAEARRQAEVRAGESFDLARGPLLRAKLLRLAPEEHHLVLTMHHICNDAWSGGILLRELAAFYEAFSAGTEPSLDALPIQYADFAAWQRQWLRGEVLESQLAYWKAQLAPPLPVLELPTDRPRPPLQTFRGAHRLALLLAPAEAQAFEALTRREGATLFMSVLAAFNAFLFHYTGQTDIVVGSPIAGRNRRETEGLIGFFVNNLALRNLFDGDVGFRELLARVRDVTLGAYAHQELPFERLVDALQLERDPSRTPVFQATLSLQNAVGAVPPPASGLGMRVLEVESGTSKFDLSFFVSNAPLGLVASIEYSTDLFDDSTIQRMAGHFRRLLEGVVAEPGRRLVELPLLDEGERRRVLVEWNQTSAPAAGSTLQEMFEEQVRRRPEAVAVEYAGERRTYEELNRWANQLAHALRSRGVGPDVVVGLCLDRGLELVAGMLGILKAGGAYLPLDASLPVERLTYMMQDAGVPVLLTQERLAYELPSHGELRLSVDEDWGQIERQPETEPKGGAGPGNLAYVLYTSGSTGKPKGVQVEHRSVCNTIQEALRDLEVRPGKRVLQFASVGFDVSVQEVFTALLGGATLVMAAKEELLPGPGMAELLKDRGLTTLMLAAPVAAALPEEGLEGVDAMMVGGEACTEELVERWGKGRRLVQGYGPTEASITVTSAVCRPGEGRPALGRPYANTRLYVLNEGMQPVPVGVVGELYIGGRGLARGYLGRPELTAERFCPDPFSGEEGARLYRTGDRVKYRPDGNLEFVGRTDFQVKLRGFRIELGEIEAALGKHSAVDEAVVLLREDSPGDKRLVAYVVPRTGHAAEGEELKAFLQARLPEYMVPSAFVGLEALPLTPNGKVDRKALPKPDKEARAQQAQHVPPRTPVEQALADIWADVLKLERVSINDSFFDLGGDSLMSVQVITRAREAGMLLDTKALFTHQTIARLAPLVGEPSARARVDQGPVSGPVPLTPIQRRFFDWFREAPHHFNLSLMTSVRDPIDRALLEQALGHLLRHHDALRLYFVQEASGWRQLNADVGVPAAIQWFDVSGIPEPQQSAAVAAKAGELQGSLDLSKPPLLRAALFHRGAGRTDRLLLVLHHLVADEASTGVLLQDLETAYLQLQRGAPVVLPEKTTSYKAWAERLESHARSEEVARDASYWIAPRAPARPLPMDKTGGANTVASMRGVSAALDAEETRLLLQEVPSSHRASTLEVLLTALGRSLAPWVGTTRLRVELDAHGRDAPIEGIDLSRTVGWFTTMYPVELALPEGASLTESVAAVRDQMRRLPNRGLAYDLLRYMRDDSLGQQVRALPPVEVKFNYHGHLDSAAHGSAALFSLVREPAGPPQSNRGSRPHVLDMIGGVVGGRLELSCLYSEDLHERSRIEALVQGFVAELRALIARRGEAKPFST